MAIGVLVELLLPDGGGGGAAASGGKPLPKDEAGFKEWIRNKLKALASLLGRLVCGPLVITLGMDHYFFIRGVTFLVKKIVHKL